MIKASISHLAFVLAAGAMLAAFTYSASAVATPTLNKPVEQETIERGLIGIISFQGEEALRPSLEERMEELGVRSASVAVYSGGELHWASSYGEAENADTLFQAASLGKAVAAVGIVSLAFEVGMDLDADLTPSLPVLQDERVNPSGASVSLRQLLSHSAGVTISGFPGYAPEDHVPSTLDIVLGENGSNTPGLMVDPDRIGRRLYSGGGFHLAQHWAETVSGEPFPALMKRLVLDPVGMEQSTFDLIRPGDARTGNLAPGYGEEGLPEDGGWLLYPQSAAAGLWSTPTEYGRFISALLASVTDNEDRGIHPDVGREVLTPAIDFTGLAVGFQIRQAQVRLSNSGDNRGYWNHTMSFPARGDVIVVMTNGPGGFILMGDINRTTAEVYNWPAIPLITRERLALTSDESQELPGIYVDTETGANVFEISVDTDGGITLSTSEAPDCIWSYNGTFELVKTGPNTFINTRFANELTIQLNSDGETLVVRRGVTYRRSLN
ncbi:serine hydrolase domain-containing protein [Maricaulis sp. MIT060901]|uniref:serine hydrolase domain-containing protein n=1 Tax=Maricaulis sp. MIT060901 TaxID=3096993 RepID=UPI00399967F9